MEVIWWVLSNNRATDEPSLNLKHTQSTSSWASFTLLPILQFNSCSIHIHLYKNTYTLNDWICSKSGGNFFSKFHIQMIEFTTVSDGFDRMFHQKAPEMVELRLMARCDPIPSPGVCACTRWRASTGVKLSPPVNPREMGGDVNGTKGNHVGSLCQVRTIA